VRELDLDGIALADLRGALPGSGVDAFAIDEVRVRWTPRGLWRGEIGEAVVRGVRAEVHWPMSAAADGDASAGSAPPTAWLAWLGAATRLALEDAQVRARVGEAELELQADLALTRAPVGGFEGEGALAVRGRGAHAQLDLRLDPTTGREVTGTLRVDAQLEASAQLPARGSVTGELSLRGSEAGLQVNGVGCPRVRIAQVEWDARPRLRTPIDTCLVAGDAPLLRVARADGGFALEATLELQAFALGLRGSEPDQAGVLLEAEIASSTLHAVRAADATLAWQVQASGSRLRLPGAELDVRDWSAKAEADARGGLRVEVVKAG